LDNNNMNAEATEKLGFKEWQPHYEKQQEADRKKVDHLVDTVSDLGGDVRALTANLGTWIEAQKGTTARMNRPWQWGVVVAIFIGLFSVLQIQSAILGLVINPIIKSQAQTDIIHSRDVERNLSLHMWFRETMAEMQVADAQTQTRVEYLMKMEERLNNRLHGDLK
jgi:hypothetical protein